MKVLYWPQRDEKDVAEVSLEDFLGKLKRKRPDLWTLAQATINQAEKAGGMKVLQDNGKVGPLRGLSEPVWEFRIPPEKRGGVVRIYFCFERGGDNILCLDAELKKRSKASGQKVESACRKYRELERIWRAKTDGKN